MLNKCNEADYGGYIYVNINAAKDFSCQKC